MLGTEKESVANTIILMPDVNFHFTLNISMLIKRFGSNISLTLPFSINRSYSGILTKDMIV